MNVNNSNASKVYETLIKNTEIKNPNAEAKIGNVWGLGGRTVKVIDSDGIPYQCSLKDLIHHVGTKITESSSQLDNTKLGDSEDWLKFKDKVSELKSGIDKLSILAGNIKTLEKDNRKLFFGNYENRSIDTEQHVIDSGYLKESVDQHHGSFLIDKFNKIEESENDAFVENIALNFLNNMPQGLEKKEYNALIGGLGGICSDAKTNSKNKDQMFKDIENHLSTPEVSKNIEFVKIVRNTIKEITKDDVRKINGEKILGERRPNQNNNSAASLLQKTKNTLTQTFDIPFKGNNKAMGDYYELITKDDETKVTLNLNKITEKLNKPFDFKSFKDVFSYQIKNSNLKGDLFDINANKNFVLKIVEEEYNEAINNNSTNDILCDNILKRLDRFKDDPIYQTAINLLDQIRSGRHKADAELKQLDINSRSTTEIPGGHHFNNFQMNLNQAIINCIYPDEKLYKKLTKS